MISLSAQTQCGDKNKDNEEMEPKAGNEMAGNKTDASIQIVTPS